MKKMFTKLAFIGAILFFGLAVETVCYKNGFRYTISNETAKLEVEFVVGKTTVGEMLKWLANFRYKCNN